MTYDFDHAPNRRAPDAVKWAVGENELPLWIADMDFAAAPEIREALGERLDRAVFGYGDIPESWYQAYRNWWARRHAFSMDPEGLIFCTGVVPAISTAVRKLTTPAENVAILTPVYNIFYNSIRNNGRNVLEVPLKNDGGAYAIDLDRLETALADPQTRMLIFCNPHNPVGKIWDRETLAAVGALAKRYGVTVVSDEIHCDIAKPGRGYIPFASVDETCAGVSVTCIAPTKAFNLAGLQTAAVYCADPLLRHKMRRALNTDEVAEPNAFAVTAAEAAFNRGEAWLDALNVYLWENRALAERFFAERMPAFTVTKAEATYLLWLDGTALGVENLPAFFRERAGVVLSGGRQYGATNAFLRLNLACPRSRLNEALERMADAVNTGTASRAAAVSPTKRARSG